MSVVFDSVVPLFSADEFLIADYEWDSWRSTEYFMFLDAEIIQPLSLLNDEAVAALTLAMVEWVCARHGREPMTAQVLEYVDAVWTAAMTGGSVALREFESEAWRGPVLEPLRFAQLIASEIPYEADEDGNFLARASWAYHLARHVVGTQRATFETWFQENLRSLQATHPFGNPGWRSIFDETFSAVTLCPPSILVRPGPVDPTEVERGIREQVRRTEGNRYLAQTLDRP